MRKRLLLISIAILIVASLGVLGFYLSRRKPVISREQAIAKVRAHFGDRFYGVEKIELRRPTSQEASLIQRFGQEPPDLVWVVRVDLSWQTAIVLLDARTGEILWPIGILA